MNEFHEYIQIINIAVFIKDFVQNICILWVFDFSASQILSNFPGL